MYISNYIHSDGFRSIPTDSGGIPEFRSIPTESVGIPGIRRNSRIPADSGGICGGIKSIVDLDEFFKLTPKIKSRDVRPTSELSALCKGDHRSCPHPSYSPDRRTLGPEYCADRLFFNEFYHDVDSSANCDEWQRASIMKEVGVQVPNVGECL